MNLNYGNQYPQDYSNQKQQYGFSHRLEDNDKERSLKELDQLKRSYIQNGGSDPDFLLNMQQMEHITQFGTLPNYNSTKFSRYAPEILSNQLQIKSSKNKYDNGVFPVLHQVSDQFKDNIRSNELARQGNVRKIPGEDRMMQNLDKTIQIIDEKRYEVAEDMKYQPKTSQYYQDKKVQLHRLENLKSLMEVSMLDKNYYPNHWTVNSVVGSQNSNVSTTQILNNYRDNQDRSFMQNYQGLKRSMVGGNDQSQFVGRDPSLYNQEEGLVLRIDFIENLPVAINSVRMYITFFQKGDQSIKCNWSQLYKTDEESYRSKRCLPKYRSRFSIPPSPDIYLYIEVWGFPSEQQINSNSQPTQQGWTTNQLFDNYGSLIPGKFHLPFYKVGTTDPNELFVMKSQYLDGSFINIRQCLPKDPMLDFESTIFNANEYRVPAMHAQPTFVKWGDNNYINALQERQQWRPAYEDMKNKDKSDKVQVIRHASEIFEPVERLPQDLDENPDDDDISDDEVKKSQQNISLKMNDFGTKKKQQGGSKRDIDVFAVATQKSILKVDKNQNDDEEDDDDEEQQQSNDDEDNENENEKKQSNQKNKKKLPLKQEEIFVDINQVTNLKSKGNIKYKIELLHIDENNQENLIKDKEDYDCQKEGLISIEETAANLTIFEHQDVFSTEENALLNADYTKKNSFLKISLLEEKGTVVIGMCQIPLIQGETLAHGNFEENLVKPEKGKPNVQTNMVLSFQVAQQKPIEKLKFDEDVGMQLICQQLQKYTAKQGVSVSFLICQNNNVYVEPGGEEDDFTEIGEQVVQPDVQSKTVNLEENYSLDFPFNYEKIAIINRKELLQFYLIISILKQESEGKQVELGWICHPLYKRKLFNSGQFSSQLYKPPMKMIPPQQCLKECKKIDQILSYTLEESSLGNDDGAKNKIPQINDNGYGLYVDLISIQNLEIGNNDNLDYTIEIQDGNKQTIQDRNSVECIASGPLNIESREKGLLIFEHQSFFAINESLILQQLQKQGTIKKGPPKHNLLITISNTTKKQVIGFSQRNIFQSQTQIISGTFTEAVLQQNGGTATKYTIKFMINVQVPINQLQFSAKVGVAISLLSVQNCNLSSQQKLSANIFINEQHNTLCKEKILKDCEIVNKMAKFPSAFYNQVQLPFQHDKYLAQQRNKLADYQLFIQLMISNENSQSDKNQEYGWIGLPIFRNRQLNEGKFSISLLKPPAILNSQLIQQQGGLSTYKKIDAKTVLEFVVEGCQIDASKKKKVIESDDDDDDIDDDANDEQNSNQSNTNPGKTLQLKDEELWVEVNLLSGFQITSQSILFSYKIEIVLENDSTKPLKDKKNKDCKSEGILSIENSEILFKMTNDSPIIFEHASIFNVEDNYLKNLSNGGKKVVLLKITVIKEKPNKTVIGTIEHVLLPGDKDPKKINIGQYDKNVFQSGGGGSNVKLQLNYSISLKPLSSQQKYKEDEGFSVNCLKITKYKDVDSLRLKYNIISNNAVDADYEIKEYYEPKQGIIDFQNNVGSFFNYQYSKTIEENRNKLNNFAIIIQTFKKSQNKEVEHGWTYLPLFGNKKINQGKFTKQIMKSPAKLSAPLVMTAYQQMETTMEFEIIPMTKKEFQTLSTKNQNQGAQDNENNDEKNLSKNIIIHIEKIQNVDEPLGFGYILRDKNNFMENDNGELAANEVDVQELEDGTKNIVYDEELELGINYTKLIDKYKNNIDDIAISLKFQNEDNVGRYWYSKHLFKGGKFEEGKFEEKLFLPPLQDPLKINKDKIKLSNAILHFTCKLA